MAQQVLKNMSCMHSTAGQIGFIHQRIVLTPFAKSVREQNGFADNGTNTSFLKMSKMSLVKHNFTAGFPVWCVYKFQKLRFSVFSMFLFFSPLSSNYKFLSPWIVLKSMVISCCVRLCFERWTKCRPAGPQSTTSYKTPPIRDFRKIHIINQPVGNE